MSDMTIMGEGMFGERHRGCQISKVENGYRVKVIIEKTRKRGHPPAAYQEEDEDRVFAAEEEYVFYTVEEVLDFVKNYLNSGRADLKRKKE